MKQKHKIREILVGLFYTTRFFTCFVVSLMVLFPNVKFVSFNSANLLIAINLLFSSMGGFALNDYFDSEKDKINKPYRAIPSNRINRNLVLKIAIAFLTIGLILSMVNLAFTKFGIIQLIFLSAMVFYNYIVKHLALTKAAYTAIVSALIISYPVLINEFDTKYILLPVGTLFFVLGREIFMDVLDIIGDKQAGMKTVPIRFGIMNAVSLAFTSIFIGTLAILVLLIDNISILDLYRLIAILVSVILFSILWLIGSKIEKRAAIISLWIPMIVALSVLIV